MEIPTHRTGDLDVDYKMGDTVLGTAIKENDLRATLSADINVSERCDIAVSNGNHILGLIKKI